MKPSPRIKRSVIVPALLLALSLPLFGKGKAEEAPGEPLNPKWTLSITAFDVSALSPAQRVLGDLLIRSLVSSLTAVHHRVRVSGEYSYYKDLAYIRALEDAGKKLAVKRTERDMLAYKGYPDWRYRSELKTIDAAVKTLEEDYAKAEEETIRIAVEPEFTLTAENVQGNFPSPPAAGAEYQYCVSQKADAFVSGAISEFHGRLYVAIRMYTLYTRSFEYEDTYIFSTDDLLLMEEEMAGRLIAAISGASPAAVSVTAEPPEAVILVRNSFAGQGSAGVREHAPGPLDVAVFADGYEPMGTSVDLAMGELIDMEFKLRPTPETSFEINFPSREGSLIYQGSLYVGRSPLTITAPMNQFEYIKAETSGGDASSVVFRAGQTGNVITMPDIIPKGRDPKPLATARRKLYGGWTAFWIALPVAFMFSGFTATYKNAYTYAGDPEMGNIVATMDTVSTGLWIGFGGVAAYSLYRMIRYGHTAGRDAPRMAQ
ncbi:MAG: hypothetical protein LBG14_03445 [Treponema sp.]|jgi:hypothetical protein|nr:hypothetical protein [Treponema sp.]